MHSNIAFETRLTKPFTLKVIRSFDNIETQVWRDIGDSESEV